MAENQQPHGTIVGQDPAEVVPAAPVIQPSNPPRLVVSPTTAGTVRLDFGGSYEWIEMPPAAARLLADLLRGKAAEVEQAA